MKTVKLTKKQIKNLTVYRDKEEGIKMGLEALSQVLRETRDHLWIDIHSIEPKARKIDWKGGCLEVEEVSNA